MPGDAYRWLAKYYDDLFEFRRAFDAAHERVLGPLLPRVKSACDLCAGTGTTALQFAGRGIETFAVDLSAEMCRAAREKARRAGLPVRVLRGDMRTFRLPRRVDLVTCEFDALNHVPRKEDLRRVARSVARALRPGGHFVFDVNNRLAFERVWRNTWFLEKDRVSIAMHGTHEPGTDRAWTEIVCFIREGRHWTRKQARVEQVCWSAGEIRSALEEAGFDRLKRFDAARFFNDALTIPGCRTFWAARKRAAGS